jgi:signal transduction histidine kinase
MRVEKAGALILRAGKSASAMSPVRPVALLVACGIVLAAALLIVTGLAAGYLREQTLAATEFGLDRLDAVLAESGSQSLHAADAMLGGLGDRLNRTGAATAADIRQAMTDPETTVLLNRWIEFASRIGAVALIDAAGATVSQAGAWPLSQANAADSDYFATLRGAPELDTYIGAPIEAGTRAGFVIPLARKLRTDRGDFAGVAVAAIPAGVFESAYRSVSLGDDGVILLLRRDGVVLAQFPPQPGAVGTAITNTRLLAALAAGGEAIIEEPRAANGQWRIDAVRTLANYPMAVVVSRGGDEALLAWSRQAMMFGAFTIFGVIVIGVMVLLIAGQFRTHSALTALRAEKIEVEHARLLTEAELLKKERLSVLGQFTATVADELRNPLSAIRNTLFTMHEIATNSGLVLDRPIARIQRSIARCDGIIGDLLEYTRSPDLSRVPVEFDRWLKEVLDEHNVPAAVTLVREFDAGEAAVRIDSDRLRRAVINLVDNAAQAQGEMAPGSGGLRVSVRTAIRNGELELAVADTGPGIPPERLGRIFEPLFSPKGVGTGLGLASVKQIVSQHNGSVAIDSELGHGTSVTVRLPLETAAMQVAA